MSFEPLLQSSPVIVVHAFAAVAAFVLGVVQFVAPKGILPHRTLGWIWVCLMALIALSSFGIHQIRQFGDFSLIHLLSIFTLIMLPVAVISARKHDVKRHSRTMTGLFVGALVIAGAFTLLPGRIMHDVVLGR